MKLKYTLVFTIISFFITTVGFTQTYSDQEIGLNVEKLTVALKEHGVLDKDLAVELAVIRASTTRQYLETKKIEDNLLEKIRNERQAKAISNKNAKTTEITDISPAEKNVLLAFYNKLNGSAWGPSSNWDFSTPVTSYNSATGKGWQGVTVENGSVVSLNFVRYGLSGEIPIELAQLPNLEELVLTECNLTGSIPAELGQLTKLKTLYLAANRLEGSLPVEITNLSNLEYLILRQNFLTGSIPTEINHLAKLKYIYLYSNRFSGSIPSQIGELSELTQLNLSTNQLTGPIPSQIGQLSKLTWLGLGANPLNTTIPVELGQLSSLEYLDISSSELYGSIPTELGQLNKLVSLSLHVNRLSGSIPVELAQLSSILVFNLYVNELTGSIPTEFNQLQYLYDLHVSDNKLDGTIPDLTNSIYLRELAIGRNKFRFIDFAAQYSLYKSKLKDYFFYAPQAKTDTEQSIIGLPNKSITFTMCENNRYIQNVDTFQWYKGISPNGVAIPGANSRQYTISDLSSADSGDYYCLSKNAQITNPNGVSGQQDLILERQPIHLTVNDCVNGTIKANPTASNINTQMNFSFESASINLTYQWTFYNLDNSILSVETTSTATKSYSVSGNYNISLIVTDENGCKTTFNKTITICPPTIGSIKISNQNILTGLSEYFSFETTQTNLTYKWTFYNLDNSSSTTSTSSALYYSYNTAGSYNIILEVTNRNGCKTLFNKAVVVTQRPPCVPIVGTILPSSNNQLVNSNITFSLDTATTGLTYQWSFYKLDGSFDSSSTNSTVIKSYSQIGTYQVVLGVTDSNRCFKAFEKTITINSQSCIPIAGNITTSTPDVFVGTSTNFSLETTATNLSYKWTFTQDSESTIFTTKTVDYTYIRPGTNNVTLEVTDSNGCKSTFQKLVSLKTGSTLCNDITQFGRAFVQVGNDTNLFKAATVSVNQTTNVIFSSQNYGPGADFEYKWSLLNENNQLVDSGTNLNFPITPTTGGLYTVVLDLKENTTGCTHQFTRAIICTIPNSCAQTNPQSTTVKGLVVNLLKNLMSRAMMGESDVQINSSAVTAEFNALKPYITSGPKDKIYNFTSTRSLSGEFTSVDFSFSPDRVSDVHISVPHGLQYSQGMPLEYLQSSMIEPRLYIDLSQYTSANQYLISCLSDGTGKSLLKPNDCQYGSEIRYIDFCPNECDPLLGVVKVSTEKPTLNTAINFSLETAATGLTYNWTFYNADNTVKGNQTSAIGSQTYTAPGNYKIVLIATDSNNCNTTITKNINIAAPSCVAATGTIKTVSPNIFAGTTTNFFFDTTATNLTYQWTLYRNVNYSVETFTTNTANMYYDVPGSYNVKLVVTDTNGCTNTFRTTAVVTAKPPCVTVAGDIKTASPIIYTNENTTYSFDTTATNLTYNWTFHSLNNTPLGTATTSTASVVYPYAGNYVVTLVIVDENNCATTINKNVTVQVKHICTEIAGSIKTSTEKIKTNNNTVFSLQTTATNITYKWIFYNTNSVEIGTATTSTAEWVYTTPGDYLVALEITDQYACKTKLYKTVKVTEPVPCTPLVGTIKMDTDTPFLYTYATFTFETTATDLTYTWNVKIPENGGSYNYPQGGNPFQLYLQYGEGEYTILLDVKDSNDCVTHFEKKITPIYDCRMNSLTGIIYNRTHPNYYSPQVLINKPNEFTFWPYSVWNLDDLTLNWELSKMDDTPITSFTGEIFVFTPTTSDNLKLKLTITDRNNCPHYFDRELEVTEACEFSEETIDGFIGFQSEDNTEILTTKINEAKMLLFTPTKEIERNYSYKWQVYNSSEQLLSSGTENNHPLTLTNPGFYKVTLDLENEYGCVKKFSKTINCLIENSCTYENPKSEIVKKVFVNFVKNLIVRSLKGETDAQINSFGTRTGFSALRAYITNGTKDNIYNYSTSRDEKGKLTTIMFSFSPETQYDVKIYVKKGIWNYEQIANGTTNEFASKIESEIYLNLEQFISPDDYLVSCFNQKPQNSTVTKFVPEPNDCLLSSEIRHIDFCPAEACLPTIGIIRTGTSITYPPQFDKSSKQTK